VSEDRVAELLARAGFLSPTEDAAALQARAGGDHDELDRLVARRLTGEPLAWIVGGTWFCGQWVIVHPHVYVPRPQSEAVVRAAVDRLPVDGVAVDVCTGSGAAAVVLHRARPAARVVGCDIDAAAVACARANGVEAFHGDLLAPVPTDLRGRVDAIVGVAPYVPTDALASLQRDTFTFERPVAYDGGPDGLDLVRRLVDESRAVLHGGGALAMELGGDQAERLEPDLERLGFVDIRVLLDAEGDTRGIAATFGDEHGP
jgi:release factor glutamine methyltransferase